MVGLAVAGDVILCGMSQPPEMEARVAALEAQVRDLAQRVRRSEQNAAAARVLAGGADRDVSEYRTEMRQFRQQHTAEVREFRQQNSQVLNAMRRDVTTLREEMNERFARLDEQFARVDGGFADMRGQLDVAAAGLQQISGMLSELMSQGDTDDGEPDAGSDGPGSEQQRGDG